MIELSNSKKTYLGKSPEGKNKWALDASIGAIQFRETGGEWQDIDPSIEEADTDGFSVKFTKVPYLGRIGEDSRRRIYPDRTNLDCWIEFEKPYASMGLPTRQDGWFYWNFPNAVLGIRFDSTAVKFGFRLKNSSAPTSITIPFTTQGLTRQGRLLYHNGEVVAELRKPVATDADRKIRECDITFGTGEVTISLDTTGLTFPIEIDPTLDLQVGASSDDIYVAYNGSAWGTTLTAADHYVGYAISEYQRMGGAFRFLNVTIPQASTIDTAYLTLRCSTTQDLTVVRSRLRAEDSDNAITFSTTDDYLARPRTASVDWDSIPAWTLDANYNSPSIITPVQAVVNRAGWASGNALVIFWDDHDNRTTGGDWRIRMAYTYDRSSTYAPKIHLEYTPPPDRPFRQYYPSILAH